MEHREIALGRPSLGTREMDAVRAVFESGWVAGQGPTTRAFEAAFASSCGVDHAVAVNNCTAALHLALLALGVGPDDEVIVADYTYPATGHAVRYLGPFDSVGVDPGLTLPRGETVPVSASVWQDLKQGPASGQFAFYVEERKACCG